MSGEGAGVEELRAGMEEPPVSYVELLRTQRELTQLPGNPRRYFFRLDRGAFFIPGGHPALEAGVRIVRADVSGKGWHTRIDLWGGESAAPRRVVVKTVVDQAILPVNSSDDERFGFHLNPWDGGVAVRLRVPLYVEYVPDRLRLTPDREEASADPGEVLRRKYLSAMTLADRGFSDIREVFELIEKGRLTAAVRMGFFRRLYRRHHESPRGSPNKFTDGQRLEILERVFGLLVGPKNREPDVFVKQLLLRLAARLTPDTAKDLTRTIEQLRFFREQGADAEEDRNVLELAGDLVDLLKLQKWRGGGKPLALQMEEPEYHARHEMAVTLPDPEQRQYLQRIFDLNRQGADEERGFYSTEDRLWLGQGAQPSAGEVVSPPWEEADFELERNPDGRVRIAYHLPNTGELRDRLEALFKESFVLLGREKSGPFWIGRPGHPRSLAVHFRADPENNRVEIRTDPEPVFNLWDRLILMAALVARLTKGPWNPPGGVGSLAAGSEERRNGVPTSVNTGTVIRSSVHGLTIKRIVTERGEALEVEVPSAWDIQKVPDVFAHADLGALLQEKVAEGTRVIPLMHPQPGRVSTRWARRMARELFKLHHAAKTDLIILNKKYVPRGKVNAWVSPSWEIPTLVLSEKFIRKVDDPRQWDLLRLIEIEWGEPLRFEDFTRELTPDGKSKLTFYL